MMALATRFNPAKYVELTTADPNATDDGMIGLAELSAILGQEYSVIAVHKWRERGAEEGGYGPVGTPAPDKVVSRGGAAGQPFWYPWTLELWLGQTGRRNLVNRLIQHPRRPGRGRPTT